MRVLRAVGNGLLWALAALGVLSGALLAANRAGWIQPVVVISGSMSPGIAVGDLLLATPTPIEELEPGTVATLTSARTGNYVTHRVVAVEDRGDHYAITMRGDANDNNDQEEYLVKPDARVWQPAFILPGVGSIATEMGRPGVTIPALIAIAAMVGVSAVPRVRGKHERVDPPRRRRRSAVTG